MLCHYLHEHDRGSLHQLSPALDSAQRHARAPQPTHLRVAESCDAVSDSLKLLGVTLDHTMSFNKHVSTIVRACNFHLSALRHIR